MGRRTYSKEFMAQVTKEAIDTNNTALVAKRHGLSQRTVYNWFNKEKNKDSLNESTTIKTLQKQLEKTTLENKILKELLKKTYHVWNIE